MLSKKLFLSNILVFVLLSFGFVVSVEASSTTWSRTYGGKGFDSAESVIQTSDGGYAIVGRTESFGNGLRNFWLVKTDSSGNMEWNKTYGGERLDIAYSVVETSDGGYAIAGLTYSFGAGSADFWLIKTDTHGNMEWNRTYGGTAYDTPRSLLVTSDGGYAIAGGALLVKTDSSGNMEWTRTYGGDSVAWAKSVVQTSDGGYVIAGEKGGDFWLIKTDEYGIIPEWYPPYICVDSPQKTTYTTDNVSLNFTVNEETSWMGYSLNGQDNVTITETTLNLTELVNCSHYITVYATDMDGNTAASETIRFTVAKEEETEPPPPPATSWTTTAIATAAVAAAIVAFALYFTKIRKSTHKNENLLVS